MNNTFKIRTPLFGVWQKYGWKPGTWAVGLLTKKIDLLAEGNKKAFVSYWKNKKEYEIEATKVQKYPKEQIKGYDLWVYIVPITALKEINKLTDDEILRIAMS